MEPKKKNKRGPLGFKEDRIREFILDRPALKLRDLSRHIKCSYSVFYYFVHQSKKRGVTRITEEQLKQLETLLEKYGLGCEAPVEEPESV